MNITTDVNAPELRLPKPPGVFRRWLAAHPRAVDTIIVITYLFGCAMMMVFEALMGNFSPRSVMEGPWIAVLLGITAIVAVALAFRRRFPLAGLVVVCLVLFVEQGLLAAPNGVALVFLLYAIPVHRGVAEGWVGFGFASISQSLLILFSDEDVTALIGPAGILMAGPSDIRAAITLSVVDVLWLLAVLMIGINFGNRRRYVQALIDRAYQLAREREQRAQLAAAAERARIAREMHDIVAHSLSVVVTLSEAAAVSMQSQPEAAGKAMERAAETGRSALVEMRRLLGVLGEEKDHASGDQTSGLQENETAAIRAPQPSLGQLRDLVDGFHQAGLRLQLAESGVPVGDATQQLAAFRIVQEALTNALRYAGRGAEVHVDIAHHQDRTVIKVTDFGRIGSEVQSDANALPGAGRGLTGAAERARLFGGTLEAGPHGLGWQVHATVPIGIHETEEDVPTETAPHA